MKEKLFWVEKLLEKLEEKEYKIKQQLNSLHEDLQGETKSSMGDKYETSRAQLHIEIDQLNERLVLTKNQISEMKSIDFLKTYHKVQKGAFVQTNSADFLIAVGIGKLSSGKENIFAISIDSPIGKELQGKVEKMEFIFNGIPYKINTIA